MQSPQLERIVLRDTKSTSQPAYGIKKVRRLPIPLMPIAEQKAIVEAVEIQVSVIDHLEAELDFELREARGLRQAILCHAFVGKLVPQNPDDEPASVLLKCIKAERAAAHANHRRSAKPKSKRKQQTAKA
jgi:type I restriction enzyme S subunit